MERYVIHVTKECNMKCVYCYERDKTTTYTWDNIEGLIKNIVSSHKDDEKYSIEFLGGEPCLEMEYIKNAVKLFKEIDSDHVDYFIITTNGTIVTRDVIDFLKENKNVLFSISIDGTKEANNLRVLKATGENSYDRVVFNIKKLMAADIPNNQLSVHLVTHPFNVEMLSDSIRHMYEIGIKNISVGTIESTMFIDDLYVKRFIREMSYISEDIVDEKMPDLFIDIVQGFDPTQKDTRIYLKDENGVTVGETYGRAETDITKTDTYKVVPTSSILGDTIFNLRKKVHEDYEHLLMLKAEENKNDDTTK